MNLLGWAGSSLFSWRAKQELDSLNNDVNSVSTGMENFFSRLKGKTQTPLPDLLFANDLPRGLLPKNILNYEYDEPSGALVVYLPFICEIGFRDQSVLRYARKVTGILRKGSLTDVDGLKTKVIFWAKVTSVSTDNAGPDKVCFQAGMRKTRSLGVYNYVRDGFEVDAF